MNGYDIEEILKTLAPYDLAYEGEELGFVTGNPTRIVSKLAITWRPTITLLQKCLDQKIDLLINHEPLLQSRKASVVDMSKLQFQPNKTREELLAKSGLTVLRAHSNWDDAKNGNNDTLSQLLDIEVETKIPYGRVGKIREQTLSEYCELVKNKLGCDNLIVVGDLGKSISKAAVVSGSGNSLTEMSEISFLEGADVLVSGDIQDSRARYAAELGIALIDAGGYYTETPGMKNLAELFKEHVDRSVEVTYLDPGPPWKFI